MVEKVLLLKGEPYQITNKVSINNPTLGDIINFGEQKYWSVLTQICATSFDHRLALEEAGVDYLEVDDWHMFINSRLAFDYDETQILIPNINIAELTAVQVTDSGEIALVDDEGEIIINEYVYTEMVEFIRDCHGFKRNYKIPGNAKARIIFMQEARDALAASKRNANKPFDSYLEPLISALCNSEGFKYNYETVWGLHIYPFMDATRRIQKIKSADHLMSGMYSGMLDVSKMNKGQLNKDLNWLGELK